MTKYSKTIAIGLIKFYQYTLSYFLGGHCRFYPSCSEYALQSYSQLNFFSASKLVFFRLLKCHPFSGQKGFDPVPVTSHATCCKGHEHE